MAGEMTPENPSSTVNGSKAAYVQCTGNQYIDTGFIPSNTTKIEIDCKLSSSTTNNAVLGSRSGATSNTFTIWGIGGKTLRFDFGTKQISNSSYTPQDRHIYVMDGLNLKYGIDGTELGELTAATFTCPNNLVLSGVNTNGTVSKALYTIYSCKIWDNGTFVRDYIPWIDENDVYCLKDKVNNNLTYSATTTALEGFPVRLKKGVTFNFPYTGAIQNITLPKGVYKLETWGAQGGTYSSYYGGAGGYSVGIITLAEDTNLFIYVGGQPAANSSTSSGNSSAGGFNGGGTAVGHQYSGTSSYSQGGGGASDIRIGQDSLYARVIVAGGGAGSSSYNMLTYGCGGGLTSKGYSGYTASQTKSGTNGSFGQGGNATGSYIYKYGAPGGGGGWYGGGCNTNVSDSDSSLRQQAGGGSGYVYTSDTAVNYPSGCLLNSVYYLTDASTQAGNTSFLSPTGASETGHTGNGYCRITVVKSASLNLKIKNGTVKDVSEAYTKINGEIVPLNSVFTKLNGQITSM